MTDEADDKKLKNSLNSIEDAIRSHLNALEIEGLVTGWTLGVSITHFDEDSEYDGLFALTSDTLSKWSNIGMLTAMLDGAKDLTQEVEL